MLGYIIDILFLHPDEDIGTRKNRKKYNSKMNIDELSAECLNILNKFWLLFLVLVIKTLRNKVRDRIQPT